MQKQELQNITQITLMWLVQSHQTSKGSYGSLHPPKTKRIQRVYSAKIQNRIFRQDQFSVTKIFKMIKIYSLSPAIKLLNLYSEVFLVSSPIFVFLKNQIQCF